MNYGDCAGLLLLQKKYGWVVVKATGGVKSIVMVSAQSGAAIDAATIPLKGNVIYLKADCDFTNRMDKGYFYYSLDGKVWNSIGPPLQMSYTIPHFMGYRFGLFNYAAKSPGGYVDFDFFHISDAISRPQTNYNN